LAPAHTNVEVGDPLPAAGVLVQLEAVLGAGGTVGAADAVDGPVQMAHSWGRFYQSVLDKIERCNLKRVYCIIINIQ
jgi:hypothetical protein